MSRTRGTHDGEAYSGWPGIERLISDAARSSDELIAIAEALDEDADVDLPFRGKTYRYPESFFLTHAVAHGAEHRTQVLMTLAEIGVERPDLDAWAYSTAASFGKEV